MPIEGVRSGLEMKALRKPMQMQAADPLESFKRVMEKALGEVNELERVARGKAEDLAAGRTDNVHDVMIALEKSKTALEYTLTIRNKVIEAYREISRMQI